VQRLLFVVILAGILIALPLLVLSDTDIPTTDAAIPNSEVSNNTSLSQEGDFSATATITITMYTGDSE
jgi:hypothetical protein